MPIFIFWWWKLNSGPHRSPWFTRDSLGAPRGLNVFQHYTGHSLIWTFCFMHMLFFHDHMLFLFLLSVIKIFYPSFFTWLIPIYPLWLCWNSIIGFQTKFSECLLFANDTRQIRMQNSGKAHIAAAKSLQSCPTPLDGSPPSSSIPGILQARTLEWVAVLSNSFLKIFIIWLWWVLVLACMIFVHHTWTHSCSTWDLVPWPGIETKFPALEGWSLNLWTTRKVPFIVLYA